ncbi:MAG TPA: sigma factor-like helix-turn-helix DNA-binding protein [Opitutaceae bacterium]|nr:sigma factor-like helix-turn-helix DNA-binding protein [Opitutaceae bacterium]
MANSFQGTINRIATCAPAISARTVQYDDIYQDNCHRIYSLAFWMTGNELTAEQLSTNTFLRAFVSANYPTKEQIDRAFLSEVREFTALGTLTLSCVAAPATSIYGNVKRPHLEQAVLELPATEKMIFLFHDVEGYEHSRIARLLGMTEKESRQGLHQARMQVRSLVTQML